MVATPNPPSRIPSRSPFIAHPQVLHFSKLMPLKKTKTHRISSRTQSQSKNLNSNLNSTKDTPNEISTSMMPPPQDFSFFITQLFDFFSTPEVLTDYFLIDREDLIAYSEFFDSCESLEIIQFFSDLRKIFNEICVEGGICREDFLQKAIDVQNSECLNKHEKRSKETHTLSSIMSKILPKFLDVESNRTKKVLGIIKSAKNTDELSAKIRAEVREVKLSESELLLLIDYSKVQRSKKRKMDLNSTTKLNSSPYTLIPCSVGYAKDL